MNKFQKFFVKAFQKICSLHHINQCNFEKVEGQTDDYFISKFTLKDKVFEIYLYEEEAGFFCDGEWNVIERASVSTDEELLNVFKRVFERELNKPKGKK